MGHFVNRRTILIIYCFFVVQISNSANYFVSQKLGNDNYTGTDSVFVAGTSGPFQTINKAAQVVQPGDTVLVRAGNYEEKVDFITSGTSDAPIVFKGFLGEENDVKIKGASYPGTYAFNIVNKQYIIIDRLNFWNSTDKRKPILVDNSSHCIVNGCYFYGNDGYVCIHLTNNSSDNLILTCVFDDNGSADADRNYDCGIYLENCGSNNKIEGCSIGQRLATEGISERGIWCEATSNVLISNNGFNFLEDMGVVIDNSGGTGLLSGITLVNNYFGWCKGTACTIEATDGAIIQNNHFRENRGIHALLVRNSSQNTLIDDNTFQENWSPTEPTSSHIAVTDAGEGIRITNNEIFSDSTDVRFTVNQGYSAIYCYDVKSILIMNNEISNINYPGTVDKSDYDPTWVKTPEQGGRLGHGIYIQGIGHGVRNSFITENIIRNCGASAISLTNFHNGHISKNQILNNGAWGISLLGRANVVERNYVDGNGWIHGGCSGINIHGNSYKNIVRKNESINNKQGTAGTMGADWWDDGNGIIADQGADSTTIYNNICYNNEGTGIALTASSYCSVYNNTLVDNGRCEHHNHKAGLAIVSTAAAGRYAKGNQLIGNILYNNANYQLSVADIADDSHMMFYNFYGVAENSEHASIIHYRDLDLQYYERDFDDISAFNQYMISKGKPVNGIGSLQGDPLFARNLDQEYDRHDLYIQAISPARDASYELKSIFQDDFLGNSRSDGVWDMGAFEFENRAPFDFDLLEPTNETEVDSSGSYFFSWEGAVDPDPGDSLRYEITIAHDYRLFDFVLKQNISNTSCTVSFEAAIGDLFYWQVKAFDMDGLQSMSFTRNFTIKKPTGVEKRLNSAPQEFRLYKNYPNPFNNSTSIQFDVPRSEHVLLTVYNSSGQIVKVLHDGFLNAGRYKLTWNATEQASGLYCVELKSLTLSKIEKMLLVR